MRASCRRQQVCIYGSLHRCDSLNCDLEVQQVEIAAGLRYDTLPHVACLGLDETCQQGPQRFQNDDETVDRPNLLYKVKAVCGTQTAAEYPNCLYFSHNVTLGLQWPIPLFGDKFWNIPVPLKTPDCEQNTCVCYYH